MEKVNPLAKISNWSALSHSCLVIVRGNDSNEKEDSTGTLVDWDHARSLFKEMDVFAIREDQLASPINLILLLDEIKLKDDGRYKKVIFYYTGHSINAGDSMPIISFKGYSIAISTLSKYMEQNFYFSVIITDSCNTVVSRKGKDFNIFLEHPQKLGSFTADDLEYIMNNRGHLCIVSADKGKEAIGHPSFGGVFSFNFFHYLATEKSWTKSYYLTAKKLEEFQFNQGPFYSGYILSDLERYKEETKGKLITFLVDKNRERRDSEEQRRVRFEQQRKLLEDTRGRVNCPF